MADKTPVSSDKKTIFIVEIVGKIFFSCILAVMILIAVFFFLLFILGIQVHCAGDNSMEPDIPEDSLILVGKTEPSAIKSGQNVTYVIDEQGTLKNGRVTENDLTKHRLGISDNKGYNTDIMWENTVGTVIYSVPGFGSVYDFIISENNRGLLLTIAFALIGSSLAFEIIIKKLKT